MRCEFCEKTFESYFNLARHIHLCNKNIKKIRAKEYYIKFLRKNINEGICEICGSLTRFLGLELGFSSFCSNPRCKGKALKLGIKARKRLTNNHSSNPTTCKLCNRRFRNYNSLRNHLKFCNKNIEKLNSEQYYNKFLKKNKDEGICEVCKKEKTEFRGGLEGGYNRFCGRKCSRHHSIIAIKEKMFDKYMGRLYNYNIKIISNPPFGGKDIIDIQCVKCGFKFKGYVFNILSRRNKCQSCHNWFRSDSEIDLYDFIKILFPGERILANSKNIIPPKEIDIYIPKHKLTIEYNGLYWHSLPGSEENDKWKTIASIKKGNKHIVIWENLFSNFYKKNYKVVSKLIKSAVRSSRTNYLKNIKYYTTYDITEKDIDNYL